MRPVAVTIAGSDSGGGAGLQGDLKTFSAFGVYGATVVTTLTAQNTRGVQAVRPVPAPFVATQMDSVFADLEVRAVKVGLLPDAEVIAAVAAGLERWRANQVVLDPVMVASSGARLASPDALGAMVRLLLPRADLLTPNLPEAAVLLGENEATNEGEMAAQGRRLLGLGPGAVLMKGGHGSGAESVDLLVSREETTRFVAPRLATRHSHGTGCALSAAIAAGLAQHRPLGQAIAEAKRFLSAALDAADALGVGQGVGPVDHLVEGAPRRAP